MKLSSRVANVILACALSPDDRPYVLGDLAEEYAVRREETSRISATRWYWTQILRSIPWLLWSPVGRSGYVATVGVACGACAAQAAIELTTALVLPSVFQAGARGAVPVALVVVLGSMTIVSWIGSRIRPGTGVLLTLIASIAVIAQAPHLSIQGVHLSQIVEGASAPSAALLGAALAVNVRPSRTAN